MKNDKYDLESMLDFTKQTVKDKAVYIKEYEHISKIIESEEKLFTISISIITSLAAFITSSVFLNIDTKINVFKNNSIISVIIFSILLLFVSIVFIVYICDRKKSIVYAKRKMVLIRKLLNLDYKHYENILPSNRIEGAYNPFDIKFVTNIITPIITILLISFISYLFLIYIMQDNLKIIDFCIPLINKRYKICEIYFYPFIFVSTYAIVIFILYRKLLLDEYENISILILLLVAKILNYKIVSNIRHRIYKASMGISEIFRLKIQLDNLKKMLVAVEDKGFFTDFGVSIIGIFRAIRNRVFSKVYKLSIPLDNLKKILVAVENKGFFTRLGVSTTTIFIFIINRVFSKYHIKTGGSTITQQLTRSLFFEENFNKKKVKRKIFEILFSIFWVNRIFTKDLQLSLYLVSVRFDVGIYGIAQASSHFFGKNKKEFSVAESFFLIERISVLNSNFLGDKVIATVKRLKKEKIINDDDIKEIKNIYLKMSGIGKVIGRNNDIEKYQEEFDKI